MARFRDSRLTDAPQSSAPANIVEFKPNTPLRLIGEILQETIGLSDEQIERALQHARENDLRFGEAAIALGFVSAEDVLFALAQQFNYPYAARARRSLNPELVALNQPFTVQAEAFRVIRSQVMMRVFGDAAQRRALAVVSPASGDGKTYFTANLAVTLAQLGGRTLVVDADLRGPRQHDVFATDDSAGLSSILAGRTESQLIRQIPDLPNLFVLPVGIAPPNPLELVERPAFAMLMRELTAKFDHVIVDTPAAIYGSDALVIAARCGAAIVVARKDESRVGALQELVSALAQSPAKLAGVIMNEY